MNSEFQEHIINTPPDSKSNSFKRILFADYSLFSAHSGYILFVLILTLLYIYNGHVYEKKARAITREIRTIKDIEYEYKYLLEEWTVKTKESELARKMEGRGLESSLNPPYIIKNKK